MGALAGAMGFGTAGQSAQNSMVWGGAGTGVEALGNILTGVGGAQQAGYMARVAQTNAAIERANAAASVSAGNYSEEMSKLRTGSLVGSQRAAQGANNVDVNMGSAAAVQASTRTVGAMEAAMIHYNAAREAYGHQVQAVGLQSQAALYRRAGLGALEEAGYKSASTIIAGASSLSSKAAQYGLAFGQPSSAVPSVWGS